MKDTQQYTKLISWLKAFKTHWYFQAALLLLFVFSITFIIVQKRTETIVYTVSSSNKSAMQELLQSVSGYRNIISPSSIDLPFSNFHEIKMEALSSIQARLIEHDPRDSKLLTSLVAYFYPGSDSHESAIRLITTDYASSAMLAVELRKLNLDFTSSSASKPIKSRFPGLLLLAASFLSLLLVQSPTIRKRATILMLPWLLVQCLLLSESFGLLLLSVESLVYGLLHFKPLKKNKQSFLQKKFLKYNIVLIIVVLILCIADYGNLLLGICATTVSWVLSIIISKTRDKGHSAPVFAVIFPRQQSWMSRNKQIILVCAYIILIINLVFKSSGSIVPISDDEISEHYQRQLYTIQGTLNHEQSQKPILKPAQGKLGIAYESVFQQPTQVAHFLANTQMNALLKNASYSSGVSLYLLIALVMTCLFLTIDVSITAGKKFGIMIHSNNSKNIGQQDINISVTDVIV